MYQAQDATRIIHNGNIYHAICLIYQICAWSLHSERQIFIYIFIHDANKSKMSLRESDIHIKYYKI